MATSCGGFLKENQKEKLFGTIARGSMKQGNIRDFKWEGLW